jgi:hypothetical protein
MQDHTRLRPRSHWYRRNIKASNCTVFSNSSNFLSLRLRVTGRALYTNKTAGRIKMVVLCVVMPCNDVVRNKVSEHHAASIFRVKIEASLHGVSTQKAMTYKFIAMKRSNFSEFCPFFVCFILRYVGKNA